MKQRGRQSAIAVAKSSGITSQERPEPPVDLTAEQRIEWILVVNACPAEWFHPETHGLLAQYCKHMVAAKKISQVIQDFEKEDELDIAGYEKLLKMQERESRAILALARSMRLSQQATYHPEKTKGNRTGGVKSPWAEK